MSIWYINDVRQGYTETQTVGLQVVTPPSVEPVLPSDLQAQARIDYTGDQQDSLIATYCAAAREWCEEYLARSLAVQTFRMTLDHFPCDSGIIHLRRPPVQSVTSITYIDCNGHQQTLDPSLYQVVLDPTSPRIAPNPLENGQGWPDTWDQLAAVQITYVAGYSLLPARAKAAILLVASDLWNNRESQSDRMLYKNPTAESLLSTLRTF